MQDIEAGYIKENPFYKKVSDSQKAYAEQIVPFKLSWFPPYNFAGEYYWKNKIYPAGNRLAQAPILIDDSGPPMDDQYLAPCLQAHWRGLWGLDGNFPADCADCAARRSPQYEHVLDGGGRG